jgi:hypothetical protein
MEEYRYRKDKKLLDDALKILDWSLDWAGQGLRRNPLFRDIEGKPGSYDTYETLGPHNEGDICNLLAIPDWDPKLNLA